jgi:uncharacterized SAM-dependent methyltransferase
MTHSLQLPQTHKVYDEAFFEAAYELLTGWAKGNMIAYQYSNPLSSDDLVRGALLWEEFAAQHKDYYQSYEAAQLIQTACAELPEILGHPINAFVDIGPGPARSIEIKTAQFLTALLPTVYKPADVALAFLKSAEDFVGRKYPHIKIVPTVLDIANTSNVNTGSENDFHFLDGSTLLNIPEDDETPDVQTGLLRNFKNVRRIMGVNGYLAFVHDTNQDEQSLHRLYRHPLQDAFILNVLYRIARDLPISGFDPSTFSYELAWIPGQHLVAHRAVSLKEQNVILGDRRILITKGQKLQLTHSYKLPAPQIVFAAQEAGFCHVKSWDDGNNRLAFQLFRSVPVPGRNILPKNGTSPRRLGT